MMAAYILVNSKTDPFVVKEYKLGQMVGDMMVHGRMI